jgi:2-methylisocitrate lyase-like PEP mutase family enzyme
MRAKEARYECTQKLRELIARKGYTIVPSAYDPLTARLVQMTGFEAVYITGRSFLERLS